MSEKISLDSSVIQLLFIMVKMAKTGQMVRMASPGLTDKTGILLLSA